MSFRNRFRRGNALRPINRIKHVKDSQFALVAGTSGNTTIALAVDDPKLANTSDVAIGCTINGFFIVCEVYATTAAALANVYFMLSKNPGNNLTLPSPNQVGSDDNKRFVIHQEMVMLQRQIDSNPRTLFKGVVVVPRGYRRMGPGDVFTITLLAPGINIDACIQVHYKEFR